MICGMVGHRSHGQPVPSASLALGPWSLEKWSHFVSVAAQPRCSLC